VWGECEREIKPTKAVRKKPKNDKFQLFWEVPQKPAQARGTFPITCKAKKPPQLHWGKRRNLTMRKNSHEGMGGGKHDFWGDQWGRPGEGGVAGGLGGEMKKSRSNWLQQKKNHHKSKKSLPETLQIKGRDLEIVGLTYTYTLGKQSKNCSNESEAIGLQEGKKDLFPVEQTNVSCTGVLGGRGTDLRPAAKKL